MSIGEWNRRYSDRELLVEIIGFVVTVIIILLIAFSGGFK